MSHARHLLLLVIALGIAACSTPYQATFLSGGYSEKQLEADIWRIEFAGNGFTTQETDPTWLFKGFKDDIMVDVIFRSTGDIYLDDEMLARARVVDVRGCAARIIPPEDLLIIKALAAAEHMPHHWHDALGVITGSDLDWDYLVSRARRHGARRVLSLLLYAQSNDLGVPLKPVRALFESIFES